MSLQKKNGSVRINEKTINHKSKIFLSPKRKRSHSLNISFCVENSSTSTKKPSSQLPANITQPLGFYESSRNEAINQLDLPTPPIGNSEELSNKRNSFSSLTASTTPKRYPKINDRKYSQSAKKPTFSTPVLPNVAITQKKLSADFSTKDSSKSSQLERSSSYSKAEIKAPSSPLYSPFRFNSFPDSLPRVNPRSVRPLFSSNLKEAESEDQVKHDEAFGRILFSASTDGSDSSRPRDFDFKGKNLFTKEVKEKNFSIGLSSALNSSLKKKSMINKGTTIKSFKRQSNSNSQLFIDSIHSRDTPRSWATFQQGAADISHDTSISSISAASPLSVCGGEEEHNFSSPLTIPFEESNESCFDSNRKNTNSTSRQSFALASSPLSIEKVRGTRLNFNTLMTPGKNFEKVSNTKNINRTDLSTLSKDLMFSQEQFPTENESSPPFSNTRENPKLDLNGTPTKSSFRLDSTQCSPIYDTRADSFSVQSDSPVTTEVEKVRTGGGDNAHDLKVPESPYLEDSMGANITNDEQLQHSYESNLTSSRVSVATTTKGRMLRPMPDISAFDGGLSRISRRSSLSHKSDVDSVSSPQRLICPPTPWRNRSSPKLSRQNSLITSKVLASCPPQILDCLSSIEASTDGNLNDSILSSKHEDLDVGHASESLEKNNDMKFSFLENSPVPNKTVISKFNPSLDTNSLQISEEDIDTVSFNDDFQVLGQLGQGSFADVFKVKSKTDKCLYAIKRKRRRFRGKRDRELSLSEVHMMQRLQASCNLCPYLLLFVRAWQEDGYFYCQTELCCRENCRDMIDSLRTHWAFTMKNYPSLLKHFPTDDSCSPISRGQITPENTVWKILHDVSSGLAHIHNLGLVHFDIKPSNIFFVNHLKLGCICKIGDFGMTGEVGSSEDGQEGDTKYLPLEVLSNTTKHPSSDIFSLGLMIYELSSDILWELPVEGIRWHEIRDKNHIIQIPSSRSVDLFNAIKIMIHHDKFQRPTANKIIEEFPMVQKSGNIPDTFLTDYLRAVQDFDFEYEKEHATHDSSSFKRTTPTNSNNVKSERNWDVRTPTPDSNIHFFPP